MPISILSIFILKFAPVVGCFALSTGLFGLWRQTRKGVALLSALSFSVVTVGFFFGSAVGIRIDSTGDGFVQTQPAWLQLAVELSTFWLTPIGLLVGGICVALLGWRRSSVTRL